MDESMIDWENGASLACSDCGASHPEWASINRGVVVCSECCCIHRNLGRHISQIRSLKCANWPAAQLALLKQLFESGANNIWEHALLDSQNPSKLLKKKPVSNDPIVPKKENFIKAKYAQLAYTISASKEDMNNADNLNRQLWSCSRTSHVVTTLRLLAIGADPTWADPEKGNTALHVAAKENQALQVELLHLYGADIAAKNHAMQSAEDVAVAEKHVELAKRLLELEFEMTDRLSLFLCGRAPDHNQKQHFLIPELTVQPSDHLKKFQRLLQLSSGPVYERLAQDIYDEIDRREVNAQWLSTDHYRIGTPQQYTTLFLPLNQNFTATRNQLRQKLAKFEIRDFSLLIIDLLKEARRRHCGLPAQEDEKPKELTQYSMEISSGNFHSEESSRDYDEVADGPQAESRLSYDTTKVLSDEGGPNGSLANGTMATVTLDNYLELKERVCETEERLNVIVHTNQQMMRSFKAMQQLLERLQSNQLELREELRSHIHTRGDEGRNTSRQVASPTTKVEPGAVVLPPLSSSATNQSSSAAAAETSLIFSKPPLAPSEMPPSDPTKAFAYRKSPFAKLTGSSDGRAMVRGGAGFHPASLGNSPLEQQPTGGGASSIKSEYQLPRTSLKWRSTQPESGRTQSNQTPLKALFDDKAFPDNLVLEIDILTSSLRSLNKDLQLVNADSSAVHHANEVNMGSTKIGRQIRHIVGSIPAAHMVGRVQVCVNEMTLAMRLLERRCMTQPFNSVDACHAAYTLAEKAGQLLRVVHNGDLMD